MKKQILSFTALIALATYAPYTHSAAEPAPKILSLKTLMIREYIKDLIKNIPDTYFESEETFTKAGLFLPHMSIDDMKIEIARAFFLRYVGTHIYLWLFKSSQEMRESMRENITGGFSIQDFLDYGFKIEPTIDRHGLLGLNLGGKYINDLTGIRNIPNTDQIQYLDLRMNRISIIPSGIFTGFNNLQVLILSENKIQAVEFGALAGLNLKEINRYNASDIPGKHYDELFRIEKHVQKRLKEESPGVTITG